MSIEVHKTVLVVECPGPSLGELLEAPADEVWDDDLMSIGTHHRPFSDWGRRHFRNGERKGKAEGEAEAILTVLNARGIDVPDEVHARIIGCTDIKQLNTWIRRAATAEKVDELFD